MIIPNKETDKLFKDSDTSSNNEVEYRGVATGTFSSGADIIIKSKNSIMLVQSKKGISDLIQIAKRRLRNRKNKEQANQALGLLEAIGEIVKGQSNLDLSGIGMALTKDNIISLTWRAGKAYFGAAIRPKIDESSWFLVQGDIERGYKADGYLSELDYEIELPSLMQIIINTLIRQKS